jgi:hypothetical protein
MKQRFSLLQQVVPRSSAEHCIVRRAIQAGTSPAHHGNQIFLLSTSSFVALVASIPAAMRSRVICVDKTDSEVGNKPVEINISSSDHTIVCAGMCFDVSILDADS